MVAAKKQKELTYKGKPVYRRGNTIYYGDLSKRLILVLEITQTEKNGDYDISKKVKFHIRDNSGKVGEGVDYRSGERDNLYDAFDIGSWWLQDALDE